MDVRETLSALLPPPRDDEPPTLRQDILDELGDHLACAYNRELLRGAGSQLARQRVLERFGDPAAVARRLWLDAMKGKIMVQRVLIATCLVVTMASLSLVGLIWRQSNLVQRESARAAAAVIQAMTLQNENAQASQQEMLKQLSEMSEVVRSTRSLEWNPVSFKVTEDSPDGSPAAGVSIALSERMTGGGGGAGTGLGGMAQGAPTPAWRVTDGSGIADFGVVRPGDYSFHIFKTWDQGFLRTSGDLNIKPGSQANKPIVCPKTPLQRVSVRVRATWPADLEKEKLVLFASFALNPIELEGVAWSLTDRRFPEPSDRSRSSLLAPRISPATRSVLYGPATSMAQVLPSKQPFIWTISSQRPWKFWADLLNSDLREIKDSAETMEWERGTYRLAGVFVMRHSASGDGKPGAKTFEIVVASHSAPRVSSMRFELRDRDSNDAAADGAGVKTAKRKVRGAVAQTGDWRTIDNADPWLSLPWDGWPPAVERLEARQGLVNEWTISLPNELVAAVRERLKNTEAPKLE